MQKNGGYELEHIYSLNNTAIKNYYFLLQIAHMLNIKYYSSKEISFAIDIYGGDSEFSEYNYIGRAFGTAVFSRENSNWLIQKVRINRGALILIVDGNISGGSDSVSKIALAIINFSKVIILGGTSSDYYWSNMPYPNGGVNINISAEVRGLGEPTLQRHGAFYPVGGYTFIFNRPSIGSHQICVQVKSPENEIIPINFNCIVSPEALQIKK